MVLVHGQRIESEEVERIISRKFSPRDFASLCNAISWAASGHRCGSLPSFTERENVRDYGIDVEWQTELPDEGKKYSALLGSGWNVFQYKQRDISARDRQQIFSNLKTGLKGAIKDLHERTGRRPSHYVLFTNIDLAHKQKQTGKNVTTKQTKEGTRKRKSDALKALKDSILSEYDQPRKVHVEVVGAAEIAAFLNDMPHIRSAYFATNSFVIWEKAWQLHIRQKIFGGNVQLTGRDNELSELRHWIDDSRVRAVFVSGPHEIGKTRLLLEATSHRPIEVVMASDPHSMSVSDLIKLESPQNETIVIIDDPEPEQARRFVDHALASEKLKLLISLPTAENAQLPNYGWDDRVKLFRLDPLLDAQSEKLLQSAGVKFDWSIRFWLIQQTGGLPGILLFAGNLGNELRKSPESFTENVATVFETKIREQLGEDFVEKIRLLSLLTQTGVDGNAAQEIERVCKIFDSSIQANSILNSLTLMTDTGIARIRGSYVEILPPLFANHLAKSALRGRFDKLVLLFAALDQNGRTRLVRRLSVLKCEEVNSFWDELFGTNGLFKDLHSALNNIYLLRLVCGTVPDKVVNLLERSLKSTTIDERLSIEESERRELMWTLEELLFRRKTSATALQCVALLAEAETENFSNNAQGVFCECFLPFHPQFPLTLYERLKLLEVFFSFEHSGQTHLLGIKAIGLALRRPGLALALRYSSGTEPFDACPRTTYEELWSYLDGLVDLMISAATSENQAEVNAASQALPLAIEEYVYQARPESTLTRLKKIVDLVNAQKIPIESFELVQVLIDARKTLTHDHVGIDKGYSEKLRACVAELDTLIIALDKGDFPSRLKRWGGAYHQEDHEYEEVDGRRIYRSEKELRNLAEEIVHNPNLLSDSLLQWLCSNEAENAFMLFWYLGEFDQKHMLMGRIEKAAMTQKGETAFSSYCRGLCQTDRSFVSNRLDEIAVNGEVIAEAIVRATVYVGGDSAGVARLEKLIQEKRVHSSFVAQCLGFGGWIKSLKEEEFLRFLQVIVGPNLEHAAAVIDIFGSWLYHNRSIEGDLAEFAWQCLESCPTVNAKEAFDCDQLATKLTRKDIERGFRLLERLLIQPFEQHTWNPIDSWGRKNFWNALLEVDRNRAIMLVLRTSSLRRIHLSDNSREIVSQENDANILLEFAFENEPEARYICQTIDPGRPGFWAIAFRIIEKYPDSSKIKTDLEWAIRMGGGCGSWSTHYQQSSKEIDTLLRDGRVPSYLRPWIEEFSASLRSEAEQQLRSELDEQIDQSWRGKDNQNTDEQSWAIERAIFLGLVDALQKLFSKQQILDALENVDLEEQKKQAIRKKAETWEH